MLLGNRHVVQLGLLVFTCANICTANICRELPIPPLNSAVNCDPYSRSLTTCRAVCRTNFEFPSGETAATLACYGGTWKLQSTREISIPDCLPICNPACRNQGLCIAPNTCTCKPQFYGNLCEQEEVTCHNFPATPLNSRKSCSSRQCTVQCLNNNRLPDGSEVAHINCIRGHWTPDNPAWSTVPDCQPTCNPPCRNGGVCWATNSCQCVGNFKGPQCQYACEGSTPPVPVNSIVRCNSNGDCSATCRSGYRFPTGATETRISCEATGWRSDIGLNIATAKCEPICNPPCLNNGICISPDQCFCRDTYSGQQCEIVNRLCNTYPNTPLNGYRHCNTRRCLMQCTPGFKFPDGSTSLTTTCQNGFWRYSNTAWSSVPECTTKNRCSPLLYENCATCGNSEWKLYGVYSAVELSACSCHNII